MPSLRETWLTSAPSPGSTAKPWFWAGHEHAPRAGHAHGVVCTSVPEGELERPQAESEADELVAEADAEERRAAEEVADGLHRAVELRRVAGAVADEHHRRLELEHGFGVPRARNDHDLDARLGQPANDRVLAAEVEQDDARAGAHRVRLGHASLERGWRRRELRFREHPRPVDVRLRERAGVQLLSARAIPSAQRIAPSSRRRRTSALVSISSSATTPRCASQADHTGRARRITTPSVQTRLDSSSRSSTP